MVSSHGNRASELSYSNGTERLPNANPLVINKSNRLMSDVSSGGAVACEVTVTYWPMDPDEMPAWLEYDAPWPGRLASRG